MARKKLAREREQAKPSLTLILRSTCDGNSIARVYEKATHRLLATARGSAWYTDQASKLFATTWEEARTARNSTPATGRAR